MNGQEQQEKAGGLQIQSICRIIIKDLLSGITILYPKAQLIGKNTETVIRTVLKSRLYEVQTYRMCLGILNFTKKYSNKALEECCKQAIALNKQKYTFIKNTISVVADDLGRLDTGIHLHPRKNLYAVDM